MAENLTFTRCGDYYIPDLKLSYTEPIEYLSGSYMKRYLVLLPGIAYFLPMSQHNRLIHIFRVQLW